MQIAITFAQFDVLKCQITLLQEALTLQHNEGEAKNLYEVNWDKGEDTIVFELPD